MIYANKKVNAKVNSAQQTAQIIANVKALEERKLIRLEADTVFLHPEIWKDYAMAINWINCLHLYYQIKRQLKKSDSLYFKNISSDEVIGIVISKKAKVLIPLAIR